ncbi:aspartate-tRNA ligase [Cladophialophora carrionii CBS 160.54]|uniref:Aspartate-tRNA ligase n=1 Tax=Cladophialophora carrionii CBS 160.54 TaxID=1279043 RepID=V9DQ57_9EURO|nr:aspartate-tRNA ligase [Cladophialophora carrionii CBS 160.54]ETI29010.1 aspartate-tRNA ligase [Cladophialophora carrionii CBS 160.54]
MELRATLARSLQLRQSYIEISRFIRARQWHGRRTSCTAQRYVTTSAAPRDEARSTFYTNHLKRFNQSRRSGQIFSGESSSGWNRLRQVNPDSLASPTNPESENVDLYGYVTSVRPVKGFEFIQLVDPRLEVAVQVILPHARKERHFIDDQEAEDGDGSRDITNQQGNIRPHTPVKISGTIARRLVQQRKNKGERQETSNVQGALKHPNTVQMLDPYVGPVDLISHVEVRADNLMKLNAFPPGLVATCETVFPPELRHVQFRTDSELRRRIRLRSRLSGKIREHMLNHDFDEIETPILFKSTPEGAREFLVPTRKKGLAYALPQSPQQYKQVLMASGLPRYFQFARCFRDEDLRADRQPEFTQLDLEMAFAGSTDVMKTVEALLLDAVWPNVPGIASLQPPTSTSLSENEETVSDPKRPAFPQLTYDDAMSRYGSDKPDTRLGSKIRRVDSWMPPNAKGMITSLDDPIVEMIKIDMQGTEPAESQKFFQEFLDASAKARYATDEARIPGVAVYDPLKPLHGLATFGHEGAARVEEEFEPEPGDLLIFWSREDKPFAGGSTVLGDLRRDVYQSAISQGLITAPSGFSPLWIIDFPLFSPIEESKPGQDETARVCSTHHPFTAPKHGRDLNHRLFRDEPLSIIGDHYDLVINGVEVGGGSCRIHCPVTQRFIFSEVLGMSGRQIKTDFQHLLDALSAGCPPHAGFALGFDRLMTMLTNSTSVRDVIAFPKTADGEDKFAGSPSRLTPEQLATYHLAIANKASEPLGNKISKKA